MSVFESFRIALDMLRLHKMRAFLTMLGIIIGVASVTLVVMISNGFKHYLTHEFTKLGAETFFMTYDRWGPQGRMGAVRQGSLTLDDARYIMNRCPSVDIVSAQLTVPATKVTYLDREVTGPSVEGYDQYALDLNKVEMIAGRGLTQDDMDRRANVCLIGVEIRDRLFAGTDPIGKFITFGGITLQVVGVMDKIEILGQNNGKDIWLPITTAQRKWVGGHDVTILMMKPKDGVKVQDAMEEVWQEMMLRSGNKRIYRLDSRESILGVLGGIVTGVGLVLAGIAALSLLVGGIGIMNIMLVSVTERTREVGLRKALGARRNAILNQFLVEAAVLSLVGGCIGMFMAFLAGQGISLMTAAANVPSKGGLAMPFPLDAAVMAALFSAGIGVVFGLYPALRAASLSPIDALRTE
ncbi:MAG: ABC transporter permease [Fimbriimonadaceae bacterium]|nr:ABC transporter permease [Fimbriimonadaceae bacterium]